MQCGRETIIPDVQVPADRQMVYASSSLRRVSRETAALRWRHYDPTVMPPGKILVVKFYNTRSNVEKTTKTDTVNPIPVHPVLAAMLSQWRLAGRPERMGRAPGPDDLIVSLPPDAAVRRRSRHGEPYWSNDYSGPRWRYKDLPALGWRHRWHYDMRTTFVTPDVEDGAGPDVIETRVTHSREARNVFNGHNRGLHWERTCAESRSSGLRVDHKARRSINSSRPVASPSCFYKWGMLEKI